MQVLLQSKDARRLHCTAGMLIRPSQLLGQKDSQTRLVKAQPCKCLLRMSSDSASELVTGRCKKCSNRSSVRHIGSAILKTHRPTCSKWHHPPQVQLGIQHLNEPHTDIEICRYAIHSSTHAQRNIDKPKEKRGDAHRLRAFHACWNVGICLPFTTS